MKLKDILHVIHIPFILINLDRVPEDNTVQVLYKIYNKPYNKLLVGNEIHDIKADIIDRHYELLDFYVVDITPTTTSFTAKPIVAVVIQENI